MPRSVHITTVIPPPLSMARRLRIPKARQKELRAMVDELRQRFANEDEASSGDSTNSGKKLQRASAAD
jgi:hypothetical protein